MFGTFQPLLNGLLGAIGISVVVSDIFSGSSVWEIPRNPPDSFTKSIMPEGYCLFCHCAAMNPCLLGYRFVDSQGREIFRHAVLVDQLVDFSLQLKQLRRYCLPLRDLL